MPTVEYYYIPACSSSRAVEMVARIVGVTLHKHPLDVAKGEQKEERYLKLNPRGKVPFIIDGDLHLGESRAITAYLVNKYMPVNNTLYPTEPNARAKVDELLYYDAGTLFQVASRLLHPKLEGPFKSLNADVEKVFRENLAYLDKQLGNRNDNKFYFGDNLTIADISLAMTLSFVECCGYDTSDYKNIVAYYSRLRTWIPNFTEVNHEAEETLKKIVEMNQARS